jgi:putative chitinase
MNIKEMFEKLQRLGKTPDFSTLLWVEMKPRKIDTARRAACFIATLYVESGGFTRLEENLNYSAQRLAEVWPRLFKAAAQAKPNELAQKIAHKPQEIANLVYKYRMGNGSEESGDGWIFRGRGFIQLTGRGNYRHYALLLGLPFEQNPDLAANPEIAAKIAAEFWTQNDLNAAADALDFRTIRRKVNGGSEGYQRFVQIANYLLA